MSSMLARVLRSHEMRESETWTAASTPNAHLLKAACSSSGGIWGIVKVGGGAAGEGSFQNEGPSRGQLAVGTEPNSYL